MKIKKLITNKEMNNFIKFIYSIYKDDQNFCDTYLFNCKDLLFKKNTFARNAIIIPFCVTENEQVLCQALLIQPCNSGYLFMGYFDSIANNQDGVDALINEAKRICSELEVKSLIIGVNGHLSLGTGILQDNFDKLCSFDSLYNRDYYKHYFSHSDFVKHPLHTYKGALTKSIEFKNQSDYSTRFFDFKHFDRDINIFENITNECLGATEFYEKPQLGFYRELFSSFKILLKNNNIIFGLKNGKEIGYAFWHPDFNEPLKKHKKHSGLNVFLKNKYYHHKSAKINAIAVLPEHQKTPISIKLHQELCSVLEKYQEIETTFVWDSNLSSVNINLRRGLKIHKEYMVYEWRVK